MAPARDGMTPEQLEIYRTEGVVRLPDAVSATDVAKLADVVWRRLHERHGIVRDRPETWPTPHPAQLTDKRNELAAMASPALRAALDQVLGHGSWLEPARWGLPLVTRARSATTWDVPHKGWHLDLTVTADAPRTARLFVLLADLAPGGGATAYVTGSHRVLHALAQEAGRPLKSDPARKLLIAREPWFAALLSPPDGQDRRQRFMRETGEAGGVPVRVGEMTGQAGDAYLMDPLTLHAMTPNVSDAPRMMLTEWIYGA